MAIKLHPQPPIGNRKCTSENQAGDSMTETPWKSKQLYTKHCKTATTSYLHESDDAKVYAFSGQAHLNRIAPYLETCQGVCCEDRGDHCEFFDGLNKPAFRPCRRSSTETLQDHIS